MSNRISVDPRHTILQYCLHRIQNTPNVAAKWKNTIRTSKKEIAAPLLPAVVVSPSKSNLATALGSSPIFDDADNDLVMSDTPSSTTTSPQVVQTLVFGETEDATAATNNTNANSPNQSSATAQQEDGNRSNATNVVSKKKRRRSARNR